jgi:hypothetical protein
MPDTRTLELLGLIHDHLAFQELELQVVVRNDENPGNESRLTLE